MFLWSAGAGFAFGKSLFDEFICMQKSAPKPAFKARSLFTFMLASQFTRSSEGSSVLWEIKKRFIHKKNCCLYKLEPSFCIQMFVCSRQSGKRNVKIWFNFSWKCYANFSEYKLSVLYRESWWKMFAGISNDPRLRNPFVYFWRVEGVNSGLYLNQLRVGGWVLVQSTKFAHKKTLIHKICWMKRSGA